MSELFGGEAYGTKAEHVRDSRNGVVVVFNPEEIGSQWIEAGPEIVVERGEMR